MERSSIVLARVLCRMGLGKKEELEKIVAEEEKKLSEAAERGAVGGGGDEGGLRGVGEDEFKEEFLRRLDEGKIRLDSWSDVRKILGEGLLEEWGNFKQYRRDQEKVAMAEKISEGYNLKERLRFWDLKVEDKNKELDRKVGEMGGWLMEGTTEDERERVRRAARFRIDVYPLPRPVMKRDNFGSQDYREKVKEKLEWGETFRKRSQSMFMTMEGLEDMPDMNTMFRGKSLGLMWSGLKAELDGVMRKRGVTREELRMVGYEAAAVTWRAMGKQAGDSELASIDWSLVIATAVMGGYGKLAMMMMDTMTQYGLVKGEEKGWKQCRVMVREVRKGTGAKEVLEIVRKESSGWCQAVTLVKIAWGLDSFA